MFVQYYKLQTLLDLITFYLFDLLFSLFFIYLILLLFQLQSSILEYNFGYHITFNLINILL